MPSGSDKYVYICALAFPSVHISWPDRRSYSAFPILRNFTKFIMKFYLRLRAQQLIHRLSQYLLTSSCHPAHVTDNIPFSLALRIVRICTHPEDREKRFEELKALLLSREYKPKSVDAAISKARQIPRELALKKVVKSLESKRPVFVINYDPRLPSITGILRKHWRTMTQDPRLAEISPPPPSGGIQKAPKYQTETN